MKKIFLAVILLVIMSCPALAASAPEGFAGIRWLSYFQDFRNKKMEMKDYGSNGGRFKIYTCSNNNVAIHSVLPKNVFYNFLDGRFSGANMVFDLADKARLIDILTREYGPCRQLNLYSYIWEFPEKGEVFPFIIRAETLEIQGGSKIFNVGYSTPAESEYTSSL